MAWSLFIVYEAARFVEQIWPICHLTENFNDLFLESTSINDAKTVRYAQARSSWEAVKTKLKLKGALNSKKTFNVILSILNGEIVIRTIMSIFFQWFVSRGKQSKRIFCQHFSQKHKLCKSRVYSSNKTVKEIFRFRL